jgi:hypothetical protein
MRSMISKQSVRPDKSLRKSGQKRSSNSKTQPATPVEMVEPTLKKPFAQKSESFNNVKVVAPQAKKAWDNNSKLNAQPSKVIEKRCV